MFVCEDGKLGLLDFGNVQHIDAVERGKVARLLLELARDSNAQPNDAAIAAAFMASGATTKRGNEKFARLAHKEQGRGVTACSQNLEQRRKFLELPP